MINNEKYVKVIVSPTKGIKRSTTVNNVDLVVTENGLYEPEAPYTGFGKVSVDVQGGGGGEAIIESLSVTPTTSNQIINAPEGVNGFAPVSVSAVTAVIDSNIIANNIKAGVSILGVEGNVVELKGETQNVSITSSSGNTFTPSAGKNGITSITVTPNNYAEGTGIYGPLYEIVASTTPQNIQIPEGYSGFTNLFCDAVDASIDSNIVASNIKDGVTILGVTGTFTGGGAPTYYVEKTLDEGVLKSASNIIDLTGATNLSAYCLCGAYYQAVFPANTIINFSSLIRLTNASSLSRAFFNCSGIKNIDLSGLTTISGESACYAMFQNSDITSASLAALTEISSSTGCENMFRYCRSLVSLNLGNLTNVRGSSACSNMCSGCSILTSVSLDKLASVSGYMGCGSMLANDTSLTSIDMSVLTTISGSSGCYEMFAGCSNLTSVDLSLLTTITGPSACSYMFSGCSSLTTLSFPALTSSSFGSYKNQFNNIVSGITGCSIHFPSNLDPQGGSTVISELTGYPNFGGTNTVLVFDLPATE